MVTPEYTAMVMETYDVAAFLSRVENSWAMSS